MLCSGRMSGSRLIVQRNNFLLIDATAVTLGQSHQKVIQYILSDPHFLFPKYLKCSSNDFDVRGGGRSGRGGNELKT